MARRAKSLTKLVVEIDAAWPGRDKGSGSSDGWLGDQAHQTRKSDHNPDANGVVRAQDIDVDLDGRYVPSVDDEALVQFLVGLGRGGDNRLNPDGYVISCRRIWSSARGWVQREYSGSNAHAKHTHVSCTSDPAGYDDQRPWGIAHLSTQEEEMALTTEEHNWLSQIHAVTAASGYIEKVVRLLQEHVDNPNTGGGPGGVDIDAFADELAERLKA